METKNNEEMITVNGGCFPISWVRKFFNTDTADIKDGAVTAAKLDPTLVSEIQQALKGLEITGDDSSGKITVTTTAGDSIDKALPIANVKRAGLMTAVDKTNLDASYSWADTQAFADGVQLNFTKNDGTMDAPVIEQATKEQAGVMTAEMATALENSFGAVSRTATTDKVSLQLMRNDGTTVNADIASATTKQAGVMSATDKDNLDQSIRCAGLSPKPDRVDIVFINHSGSETSTQHIVSATESIAGVMSATDKQQLNNTINDISLQTGATHVDISITNTSGSTSAKIIDGATTDLAGLMTAVDKRNLNATVRNASAILGDDKVSLVFEKTDGSTITDSIPTATGKTAGLMSADDKYNIENVKDIKSEAIGKTTFSQHYSSAGDMHFDATTVGGVKVESIVTIPVAQAGTGTDTSGLMTAQDKFDLDRSFSAVDLDHETDRVRIDLASNNMGTVSTCLDAATTSSAGVMSATDKLNLDYMRKAFETLTLEDLVAYGIERSLDVSAPECTRVGNLTLHRTLPVQSLMRGCLLDDNGNVTKYLNAKDWTGETRDGSEGQVMVELPLHYRKCYTNADTNTIGVKISLYALPGYTEVPKMYVSAYEAAIDRADVYKESKLASVVNTTAEFRGGNWGATDEYDGTYRSFLGRPYCDDSLHWHRIFARNRNTATTEWNCYTYDAHKAIAWLFYIEYATLNAQADYNAQLTTEGYRQGGLGLGVADWGFRTVWPSFNGSMAFIPCGFTDSLGNGTGTVEYAVTGEDGSTLWTFQVPRYRGIENPFGHLFQATDGVIIRASANVENGGDGLSKVYVCHDPAKFSNDSYADYEYVGNATRDGGAIKSIIFGDGGELIASEVGGGSTTYYCDCVYAGHPSSGETLCVLHTSDGAGGGWKAGFTSQFMIYAVNGTNSSLGTRLCFIPAK